MRTRTDPPGAEPARTGARAIRPGRWAAAADAARYCARPAHLRRTLGIALVVGIVLTLANQGDVLLSGAATLGTGLKVATNFATPFLVSNLGLLSGRRTPEGGGPG